MAATRILEEARRREDFPAVEFRDTRLGRVAYVQGTRVQVALVYGQTIDDPAISSEKIAESFAWPQWKAAGVFAYVREFPEECRQEWEDLTACDAQVLKRSLPHLEQREITAV